MLLMDEPFAALDALTRRRMQDELLELWRTVRNTLLFVTHSVEEALLLGNRVVVLSPHPGPGRGRGRRPAASTGPRRRTPRSRRRCGRCMRSWGARRRGEPWLARSRRAPGRAAAAPGRAAVGGRLVRKPVLLRRWRPSGSWSRAGRRTRCSCPPSPTPPGRSCRRRRRPAGQGLDVARGAAQGLRDRRGAGARAHGRWRCRSGSAATSWAC